jgi:hypothetical protein
MKNYVKILLLITFIICLWIGIEYRMSYLFRLLNKVVSVLEEKNIAYHLDCGTLLGCIRQGGLLKHDTDVDVSVHLSDWDKLIGIDFSYFGLHNTRCLPNSHPYKLLSLKLSNRSKPKYCDIYANPAFPKLEVKTMKDRFGIRKSFCVPLESNLYLQMLYGDWTKPSSKHADWPNYFYNGLITSEYSRNWDDKYPIMEWNSVNEKWEIPVKDIC